MEVSGAVSRRFSGYFCRENARSSMEVSGADASPASCSLSVSGGSVGTRTGGFGLVGRRNMEVSRFCDDSYFRYYVGPSCHGGRLKKEKEAVKKRLKSLRGLSGGLPAAYGSGFLFRFDDGEFQTNRFTVEETREALERQLQQLKTEEREQKRKRKLEKAKLKASRVQFIHESSSSSSSESSDNEGNTTNTSYRIRKALSLSLSPFPPQLPNVIQGSTLPPTLPPLETHLHNPNTETVGVARSESIGRVEVCMGNKCKKMGAMALMEEFEKVMGADGVVCGCKCMGKCRDGPNVRVSTSFDSEIGSANSLCIGVEVKDVGRIVGDYLGQGEQKQSRFAPAI